MGAKRLTFWAGVAGVSILAQFGLQLLSDKVPQLGLARFTTYTQGANK